MLILCFDPEGVKNDRTNRAGFHTEKIRTASARRSSQFQDALNFAPAYLLDFHDIQGLALNGNRRGCPITAERRAGIEQLPLRYRT
jgi:hypothetical protein